MHISSFLLCAGLVAAQGFVNLDLGRKGASQTSQGRRLTRRQYGADDRTLPAPIYQNVNQLEYIINITVGTPGQRMGVTLDTGSSDLWVPTTKMCRTAQCDLGEFDPSRSSTYKVIEADGFNITYAGPGDSDAGDWLMDNVTIADTGSISNQIFGAATAGADQHGVMGIGFDTNEAPEDFAPNGVYKSVLDNMVGENVISRKAFSLYLNALDQDTGSIIFGGVDSTKYTGDLVVLPLQSSQGGSSAVTEYFVTLTSVVFTDAVGKDTRLTPDDFALSVLLDSGTSATLLDANTASQLAIGLGAVDSGQQQYVVPCQFTQTNATVSYTFGGADGVTVTVPVSELISGRVANQCGLNVAPPVGGSAIMGDSFLRSAYAVFDLDNNLAALAQAVNGKQTTSSVVAIPSGTSIPGASITAAVAGTQLVGAEAMATGSVPLASTSKHNLKYGTPTFDLGSAATSGLRNYAHAATAPTQAVFIGLGLAAGVLMA